MSNTIQRGLQTEGHMAPYCRLTHPLPLLAPLHKASLLAHSSSLALTVHMDVMDPLTFI